MSPPEEQWTRLYEQTKGLERQVDVLYEAQSRLSQGYTLYPDQAAAVVASKAAPSATALLAAGILGKDGSATTGGDAAAVTAYIEYLQDQVESNVGRMVAIAPELTAQHFSLNLDQLKKAQDIFGPKGGGAADRVRYAIQIGPNGEIIRTNDAGGFEIVDTRPELAQKQTQVTTNEMTGEAFALTLDSQGNVTNRVSLGQVAFPQVDPAQKFRFDVLNAAASIEQSMAALDVTKRGQIIEAIGEDFARQVQVGQLEQNEARLNLDRIDKAMTQRREERKELLRFAVTRESLRTNAAGETVTRLPFASQIASILTSATGRKFSDSDFEVGVGYINPDQAAQDIINGSTYNSSVPGLRDGIASTRDAINRIINSPQAPQVASAAITNMALVPGVK